jgi:hypothetical protein
MQHLQLQQSAMRRPRTAYVEPLPRRYECPIQRQCPCWIPRSHGPMLVITILTTQLLISFKSAYHRIAAANMIQEGYCSVDDSLQGLLGGSNRSVGAMVS